MNTLSSEIIPRGHYANSILLPNGIVLLSGQKAWTGGAQDPISGSVTHQVEIIFRRIDAILGELDLSRKHLIRLQCYLGSIEDYAEFNEAYAHELGSIMPVRSVLAGLVLRDGALVEIVAEALNHRDN